MQRHVSEWTEFPTLCPKDNCGLSIMVSFASRSYLLHIFFHSQIFQLNVYRYGPLEA